MRLINQGRIVFSIVLLSIFLNSCGGADITKCQEKGYAKFINAKTREPSKEEMNKITQLCVDNPKAFD